MLISCIINYPPSFIVYSGAYWLAFGYHGYFFFLSVNLLKIILNATKKKIRIAAKTDRSDLQKIITTTVAGQSSIGISIRITICDVIT